MKIRDILDTPLFTVPTVIVLYILFCYWISNTDLFKKIQNIDNVVFVECVVKTNFVPGYMSGPDSVWATNGNGYLEIQAVNAILVTHPPRYEVVTNYILYVQKGTNIVEFAVCPIIK